MSALKRKFRVLYPYLFKSSESSNNDTLVLILQSYCNLFQDQLPSDPKMKLDCFFNSVSLALTPTNVEATGTAPGCFPAAVSTASAGSVSTVTSTTVAAGKEWSSGDFSSGSSERNCTATAVMQLVQKELRQSAGSKPPARDAAAVEVPISIAAAVTAIPAAAAAVEACTQRPSQVPSQSEVSI
jgi:hypothetical protein